MPKLHEWICDDILQFQSAWTYRELKIFDIKNIQLFEHDPSFTRCPNCKISHVELLNPPFWNARSAVLNRQISVGEKHDLVTSLKDESSFSPSPEQHLQTPLHAQNTAPLASSFPALSPNDCSLLLTDLEYPIWRTMSIGWFTIALLMTCYNCVGVTWRNEASIDSPRWLHWRHMSPRLLSWY